MNYSKFFSFRMVGAAMIGMSMMATGCHVDDTNPAPSDNMDTSHMTSHDASTEKDPGMNKMADTTAMSTGKMSMGKAIPDSTKKGKKGKVMIGESPKMSGAMEADNGGVYSNVEVYPSFPGGNKGLQAYFDKNLTYPTDANEQGVEGTVDVMFTVDEMGKLTEPHIMGDKMGYGLDDEALRVVKGMPAWNPGKLKGKNVKTRFTLPVRFQLY